MGSISESDHVARLPTGPCLAKDSLPLAQQCGWQREDVKTGYSILERPYGSKRPLRIVHIGAGASGIILAKFARDRLENVEVQLYDKNHDLGGTWLENRYPGCACDIPAACYQYTWDVNPDWSQYYAGSKEIWTYLNRVADRHDLRNFMKLRHKVIGAEWNDDDGLWHVRVLDQNGNEFTDTCNILINGGGILNNWKWPDIPGLHDFKGFLMHSAQVDESFDFAGKRVAVLGIGSSGVQIISNLASTVSKLYTWVRNPTWITAGFAQRFAGIDGGNYTYTEEQKAYHRKHPESYLKYIKMIESELNQRFKFILRGTTEAAAAREFAIEQMKKKLQGNERLCDAIIPQDFGVGCRRPTPGSGFLEALTKDNVETFVQPMQCITAKGFVDSDGVEHEVDVVICATGFDTTWVPRFPIVANGVNVQDLYREGSPSYLAVGVPKIPNYFTAGGPYGSLGHGSALPILEQIYSLIIQIAEKMQLDNIKSITPKTDVCEEFERHAQLYLRRTAWTEGCSSWFKQGKVDGPLTMFPGSRLLYMDMLRHPRFEDFDILYCNALNRWQFLGNGFSTREFDGRDITNYWGLLDGKDVQRNLEAEIEEEGWARPV